MSDKEKKKKSGSSGASFLERALKSAKKTTSTLKGILEKESEEGQFYTRESKQEEVETPHLSYDSSEQNVEGVSIKEGAAYEAESGTESEPPLEPEEQHSPAVKETPSFLKKPESSSGVPAGPPPTEQSAGSGKLEIYRELTTFFENYLESYNKRYERWESSISNILSILRKMRKITKKNTEELVDTINNLYDKILKGMDQFKVKRREVERIADVNLNEMGAEFKKVLGLLGLQIKEYQMKRMTDELLPLLELR